MRSRCAGRKSRCLAVAGGSVVPAAAVAALGLLGDGDGEGGHIRTGTTYLDLHQEVDGPPPALSWSATTT